MKKTIFSALAIALLASTSMVSVSYAGNKSHGETAAKKDVIDIAVACGICETTQRNPNRAAKTRKCV